MIRLRRVVRQSPAARASECAQFALFGQPRVNVLELNLALDGLSAESGAK
ncbi:MAG: potassium-transporting ATPase subunit C [Zoogloeaceae bacterium]|nr:potassium-transporting ATPase subunit C [Zoogloeaceae bacterium]